MDLDYNTPHPQSHIIRKHINRAIQDMFLISLRKQAKEFCFIFEREDEIDSFVDKMLVYWELQEEYEVCSEILSLSKSFKDKWENRDLTRTSTERIKLMDIFKS
jgi:hypothetical protein